MSQNSKNGTRQLMSQNPKNGTRRLMSQNSKNGTRQLMSQNPKVGSRPVATASMSQSPPHDRTAKPTGRVASFGKEAVATGRDPT